MISISCLESKLLNNNNWYGRFQLAPFQKGEGLTIANALRRTLLAEKSNFYINWVDLYNGEIPYSVLTGMRESIFDILLNLKMVIFTSEKTMPYSHYLNFSNRKASPFDSSKGRSSDCRLTPREEIRLLPSPSSTDETCQWNPMFSRKHFVKNERQQKFYAMQSDRASFFERIGMFKNLSASSISLIDRRSLSVDPKFYKKTPFRNSWTKLNIPRGYVSYSLQSEPFCPSRSIKNSVKASPENSKNIERNYGHKNGNFRSNLVGKPNNQNSTQFHVNAWSRNQQQAEFLDQGLPKKENSFSRFTTNPKIGFHPIDLHGVYTMRSMYNENEIRDKRQTEPDNRLGFSQAKQWENSQSIKWKPLKPKRWGKTQAKLQTSTAYICVKGPTVIYAKNIKLPKGLKCIDPDQYIATLSDDGLFYLRFALCCEFYRQTLSVDSLLLAAAEKRSSIDSHEVNRQAEPEVNLNPYLETINSNYDSDYRSTRNISLSKKKKFYMDESSNPFVYSRPQPHPFKSNLETSFISSPKPLPLLQFIYNSLNYSLSMTITHFITKTPSLLPQYPLHYNRSQLTSDRKASPFDSSKGRSSVYRLGLSRRVSNFYQKESTKFIRSNLNDDYKKQSDKRDFFHNDLQRNFKNSSILTNIQKTCLFNIHLKHLFYKSGRFDRFLFDIIQIFKPTINLNYFNLSHFSDFPCYFELQQQKTLQNKTKIDHPEKDDSLFSNDSFFLWKNRKVSPFGLKKLHTTQWRENFVFGTQSKAMRETQIQNKLKPLHQVKRWSNRVMFFFDTIKSSAYLGTAWKLNLNQALSVVWVSPIALFTGHRFRFSDIASHGTNEQDSLFFLLRLGANNQSASPVGCLEDKRKGDSLEVKAVSSMFSRHGILKLKILKLHGQWNRAQVINWKAWPLRQKNCKLLTFLSNVYFKKALTWNKTMCLSDNFLKAPFRNYNNKKKNYLQLCLPFQAEFCLKFIPLSDFNNRFSTKSNSFQAGTFNLFGFLQAKQWGNCQAIRWKPSKQMTKTLGFYPISLPKDESFAYGETKKQLSKNNAMAETQTSILNNIEETNTYKYNDKLQFQGPSAVSNQTILKRRWGSTQRRKVVAYKYSIMQYIKTEHKHIPNNNTNLEHNYLSVDQLFSILKQSTKYYKYKRLYSSFFDYKHCFQVGAFKKTYKLPFLVLAKNFASRKPFFLSYHLFSSYRFCFYNNDKLSLTVLNQNHAIVKLKRQWGFFHLPHRQTKPAGKPKQWTRSLKLLFYNYILHYNPLQTKQWNKIQAKESDEAFSVEKIDRQSLSVEYKKYNEMLKNDFLTYILSGSAWYYTCKPQIPNETLRLLSSKESRGFASQWNSKQLDYDSIFIFPFRFKKSNKQGPAWKFFFKNANIRQRFYIKLRPNYRQYFITKQWLKKIFLKKLCFLTNEKKRSRPLSSFYKSGFFHLPNRETKPIGGMGKGYLFIQRLPCVSNFTKAASSISLIDRQSLSVAWKYENFTTNKLPLHMVTTPLKPMFRNLQATDFFLPSMLFGNISCLDGYQKISNLFLQYKINLNSLQAEPFNINVYNSKIAYTFRYTYPLKYTIFETFLQFFFKRHRLFPALSPKKRQRLETIGSKKLIPSNLSSVYRLSPNMTPKFDIIQYNESFKLYTNLGYPFSPLFKSSAYRKASPFDSSKGRSSFLSLSSIGQDQKNSQFSNSPKLERENNLDDTEPENNKTNRNTSSTVALRNKMKPNSLHSSNIPKASKNGGLKQIKFRNFSYLTTDFHIRIPIFPYQGGKTQLNRNVISSFTLPFAMGWNQNKACAKNPKVLNWPLNLDFTSRLQLESNNKQNLTMQSQLSFIDDHVSSKTDKEKNTRLRLPFSAKQTDTMEDNAKQRFSSHNNNHDEMVNSWRNPIHNEETEGGSGSSYRSRHNETSGWNPTFDEKQPLAFFKDTYPSFATSASNKCYELFQSTIFGFNFKSDQFSLEQQQNSEKQSQTISVDYKKLFQALQFNFIFFANKNINNNFQTTPRKSILWPSRQDSSFVAMTNHGLFQTKPTGKYKAWQYLPYSSKRSNEMKTKLWDVNQPNFFHKSFAYIETKRQLLEKNNFINDPRFAMKYNLNKVFPRYFCTTMPSSFTLQRQNYFSDMQTNDESFTQEFLPISLKNWIGHHRIRSILSSIWINYDKTYLNSNVFFGGAFRFRSHISFDPIVSDAAGRFTAFESMGWKAWPLRPNKNTELERHDEFDDKQKIYPETKGTTMNCWFPFNNNEKAVACKFQWKTIHNNQIEMRSLFFNNNLNSKNFVKPLISKNINMQKQRLLCHPITLLFINKLPQVCLQMPLYSSILNMCSFYFMYNSSYHYKLRSAYGLDFSHRFTDKETKRRWPVSKLFWRNNHNFSPSRSIKIVGDLFYIKRPRLETMGFHQNKALKWYPRKTNDYYAIKLLPSPSSEFFFMPRLGENCRLREMEESTGEVCRWDHELKKQPYFYNTSFNLQWRTMKQIFYNDAFITVPFTNSLSNKSINNSLLPMSGGSYLSIEPNNSLLYKTLGWYLNKMITSNLKIKRPYMSKIWLRSYFKKRPRLFNPHLDTDFYDQAKVATYSPVVISSVNNHPMLEKPLTWNLYHNLSRKNSTNNFDGFSSKAMKWKPSDKMVFINSEKSRLLRPYPFFSDDKKRLRLENSECSPNTIALCFENLYFKNVLWNSRKILLRILTNSIFPLVVLRKFTIVTSMSITNYTNQAIPISSNSVNQLTPYESMMRLIPGYAWRFHAMRSDRASFFKRIDRQSLSVEPPTEESIYEASRWKSNNALKPNSQFNYHLLFGRRNHAFHPIDPRDVYSMRSMYNENEIRRKRHAESDNKKKLDVHNLVSFQAKSLQFSPSRSINKLKITPPLSKTLSGNNAYQLVGWNQTRFGTQLFHYGIYTRNLYYLRQKIDCDFIFWQWRKKNAFSLLELGSDSIASPRYNKMTSLRENSAYRLGSLPRFDLNKNFAISRYTTIDQNFNPYKTIEWHPNFIDTIKNKGGGYLKSNQWSNLQHLKDDHDTYRLPPSSNENETESAYLQTNGDNNLIEQRPFEEDNLPPFIDLWQSSFFSNYSFYAISTQSDLFLQNLLSTKDWIFTKTPSAVTLTNHSFQANSWDERRGIPFNFNIAQTNKGSNWRNDELILSHDKNNTLDKQSFNQSVKNEDYSNILGKEATPSTPKIGSDQQVSPVNSFEERSFIGLHDYEFSIFPSLYLQANALERIEKQSFNSKRIIHMNKCDKWKTKQQSLSFNYLMDISWRKTAHFLFLDKKKASHGKVNSFNNNLKPTLKSDAQKKTIKAVALLNLNNRKTRVMKHSVWKNSTNALSINPILQSNHNEQQIGPWIAKKTSLLQLNRIHHKFFTKAIPFFEQRSHTFHPINSPAFVFFYPKFIQNADSPWRKSKASPIHSMPENYNLLGPAVNEKYALSEHCQLRFNKPCFQLFSLFRHEQYYNQTLLLFSGKRWQHYTVFRQRIFKQRLLKEKKNFIKTNTKNRNSIYSNTSNFCFNMVPPVVAQTGNCVQTKQRNRNAIQLSLLPQEPIKKNFNLSFDTFYKKANDNTKFLWNTRQNVSIPCNSFMTYTLISENVLSKLLTQMLQNVENSTIIKDFFNSNNDIQSLNILKILYTKNNKLLMHNKLQFLNALSLENKDRMNDQNLLSLRNESQQASSSISNYDSYDSPDYSSNIFNKTKHIDFSANNKLEQNSTFSPQLLPLNYLQHNFRELLSSEKSIGFASQWNRIQKSYKMISYFMIKESLNNIHKVNYIVESHTNTEATSDFKAYRMTPLPTVSRHELLKRQWDENQKTENKAFNKSNFADYDEEKDFQQIDFDDEFEYIQIDIWTNGSVTPRQALFNSFKKLFELFYSLSKYNSLKPIEI